MEIIQHIAQKINEYGGRIFYVGGCVRDKILGIQYEDIDLEVFHLGLDELMTILEQFGPLDLIGQNFGVIKLINYPQFDFSLPRKEHATGPLHTDFAISIDDNLTYIDAARRRDFTCNALMQDVLTGEILDFFAGINDMNDYTLRHVDHHTFGDDALRGLRAAQFAARFKFTIALETQELIQPLHYHALANERIQTELQKGFFNFNTRYFLTVLFELNIAQQLLAPLVGLKTKDADKYDNMLELLEQIDELHYEDILAEPLKLTALIFYLPDLAARKVLETFTNKQKLIQSVLALRQAILDTAHLTSATDIRRLKNRLPDMTRYWIFLSHFSTIDNKIIPTQFKTLEDYQRFFLMSIKNNPTHAPLIQGRDLIALGFTPNHDFAHLLRYAQTLEEQGLDKKGIEAELTRSRSDVKH